MSYQGQRDDAPEVEVEDVEVEQQGADVPGADEDGADDLGEEPGSGDADHGDQDDGAGHDGQEGRRPDEVAAKPRSAATIAVQEAKRAAKEAKAEVEVLRRERDDALRERQGRQTAEQQRLEAERIALMAPEEKFEFLLNKQAEQTRREVGALQFQMQDASDRSGFEALCARNPAFDAVRDEVERGLRDMRNGGGNTTRENLATFLIGKRAIERAAKGGKAKQSAAGQKRVQQERVAAPAGRSDVQGGQRRGTDDKSARRGRLENIDI